MHTLVCQQNREQNSWMQEAVPKTLPELRNLAISASDRLRRPLFREQLQRGYSRERHIHQSSARS
jgi:hypothetical protein